MATKWRAIQTLCSALRQPHSIIERTAFHPGLPVALNSGSVPGLSHLLFRTFVQPANVEEVTSDTSNFDSDLQGRMFSSSSRRSGVIAVKVGMTHEWDQWKVRIPLTVLWMDDCQVVQQKTKDKEGYTALQLGCGAKREKNVHFGQAGHCRAAGVPLKRKYAEFLVSPDALLPVGTLLNAAHFVPGQYVDVTGTTIGKGFQGVMKRWGFAGQPASHGNSLAHRAQGSVSGGQDPGKIWPGKKMPGRMGNKQRTVSCVWVYKIDPVRNLLYVRGQVPGHKGNFVLVKDAVLRSFQKQPVRPFPTFIGQLPPDTSVAPPSDTDPFLTR